MSDYDNGNSGILGRNKRRREGTKDPEFSGQCEVSGVAYWISGWVRVSKKDGSKFFSLSFRPKDEQACKPKAQPAATEQQENDNAVPF